MSLGLYVPEEEIGAYLLDRADVTRFGDDGFGGGRAHLELPAQVGSNLKGASRLNAILTNPVR